MPLSLEKRLALLLDSPIDRKHLPLLTNDEVYNLLQQQASRVHKLEKELTELRQKLEILRRNSIIPPKKWTDPKLGSSGVESE